MEHAGIPDAHPVKVNANANVEKINGHLEDERESARRPVEGLLEPILLHNFQVAVSEEKGSFYQNQRYHELGDHLLHALNLQVYGLRRNSLQDHLQLDFCILQFIQEYEQHNALDLRQALRNCQDEDVWHRII